MNQRYSPYGTRQTYSLGNLIRNLAGIGNFDAGYEFEISQELARLHGRKPNGVLVPMQALFSRDLTVGTGGGSTGGKLVASELHADALIPQLREVSIAVRAGATVLAGLVGNVSIPRQTGAATSYWVAEGEAPTESAPAFDQLSMSPKTVSAYTDVSRRMLLQSSLDISHFVAEDLRASIGYAIDAAVINGSGTSNQPRGILNTAGIGIVSAASAAPTWAQIVAMETVVANANGDSPSMAYVVTPEMRGKLSQTLKFPSGDSLVLESKAPGKPALNGHACHVTNHLPKTGGAGSNEHSLVFGDWSQIVIGQWGALDLLLDRYTFSNTGGLRVVAMQDLDIVVRHPEAFSAIKDALVA